MPVPTLITDLSTTAASNYPAGTEAPNVIDDTLRAHAAFIAQNYANKLALTGGTMTGSLGISSAAANGFRLDVGGASTNGPIARFWGSTVQTRGLELSSEANNATNGVLFRFNAPGASGTQGAIAFSTNGTEALFIDESQKLLVGQTDAYNADGFTANKFQVAATDGTTGFTMSVWPGATATGNDIQSLKSRGASVGTRGVVASGDQLLQIVGAGDDGTNFIPAAQITMQVDGTPGANDMPGRIVLSTTADGAASVTECARWDSSGNLIQKVNTSAPTLTTNGTLTFSLTSNTNLRVHVRGSDGAVRVANLTLA